MTANKKTWKEIWKYSSDDNAASVHAQVGKSDWELVAEHGYQRSDVSLPKLEARMKLIAQAPALAELLLRIEGLHDSDDAKDVAMTICVEWLPEIREVLKQAGVLK